MSAVTALLCSAFLFVRFFVAADPKIVTAKSGQDITLTCRAPKNSIIVVKWSRADLGNKYVLMNRDGHFVSDNQHPSFKNRVDLQDRQMKDGDVSLILKDVTINDAGTYKCRVFDRKRRSPLSSSWHLINTINLDVDPPGQTGGFGGLIVGLAVVSAVLLLVAAAAAVGLRIKRKGSIETADPQSKEPLKT